MGVTNSFDPRQNIMGGARYLQVLARRFCRTPAATDAQRPDERLTVCSTDEKIKVVAAYHAGPGAVEKYGGVPPYETTRWYVAMVMKRYEQYRQVAGAGAPERLDMAAARLLLSRRPGTAWSPLAAKRFDEAEGEILRALSGAPKDIQALNLLALVRYKLGKLEDAHATYREIAGTAPQDAHARRNLGLISLKLGRVDEALPELEMAVRLVPGDDRAWSYLGYAYAKKGEVVEAAAAFRRAGQDALALELEHAATVRRPATPMWRGGVEETPPPPLVTDPDAQVVEETDADEADAEAHADGDDEADDAHAPASPSRPVALAPPLPPPLDAASMRELRSAPPVEAPRAIEAMPVPLLSFVLSRLGQAPAPATPAGALHVSVVDEAHVRADGVLAGTGNLQWQAAHRRSQGRRSAEEMGTPGARFFRLTGSGDVWIAGAPMRWMPLALMEDVLYVREDRVLAFEGSLSWEAGTVPGADVRMLQFRGRGTVALEIGETPVAIKVTDDRPTLLSCGRLVGWVGRLVPHGARPPGDGAEAPFQVICQGEGVVLIDTATVSGTREGSRSLPRWARPGKARLPRRDRAEVAAVADLRRELTNLPNLVTMSRVVMIPFILIFIDNFNPFRSFIAAMLYLVAAAGDFLDGYLARSRGQVSMLGKFLDPLADKLLVTAVLVFMVALQRVPAWVVVVLVGRDLAISGLRSIAAAQGLVIAASDGGKIKTALQLVAITSLLIYFRYPVLGLNMIAPIDYFYVGTIILYISMGVSLFSGAQYLRHFLSAALRQSRAST